MSTVVLAPGVELPFTGKPFGETPARDVHNLRRRMARKAWTAVIVLVILAATGSGIIWHLGQPFWGNWPQVGATVVSQHQYVGRDVSCTLGLQSVIDGQPQYNHVSVGNPCKQAPPIGSVVTMIYSPDDHGWAALQQYLGSLVPLLFSACLGVGLPLAGWALLTFVAIRRLRRVNRIGSGPWLEITGVVRSASRKPDGLFLELGMEGRPDVGITFGLRGMSFVPVPAAGNTFALFLAGDGNGRVLVSLPGHWHWGESLGLIWPVPARQLADSGHAESMENRT